MHYFDQDTETRPGPAPGTRAADLSARYNIGAVPNGGYLLALLGRALCEALDRPDPLTITAHYLAPTEPGPAQIELDAPASPRRLASGSARLVQGGSERVRALATCSDLSRHDGASWTDEAMPVCPPYAECVPAQTSMSAPTPFYDSLAIRLHPACSDWGTGGAQAAEVCGWLAFHDGRPPDALALLLFADAMPPPIFRVLGPVGWVPTVELTVHLRARPAPGPVLGAFRSRHLTSGVLAEDGVLWDSAGRLVALSRQLALVRTPQR